MILSNNDELHFPYIWEKYPALHVFEQRDIMITSRLGYVKPQPEVYKTAAELHKFRWDESLFIDDKEENLIVPEELGAWAICHQENIVTNDELKMLCSDLD
jgi:FMN phosphatase YigB (HAD superfamily)